MGALCVPVPYAARRIPFDARNAAAGQVFDELVGVDGQLLAKDAVVGCAGFRAEWAEVPFEGAVHRFDGLQKAYFIGGKCQLKAPRRPLDRFDQARAHQALHDLRNVVTRGGEFVGQLVGLDQALAVSGQVREGMYRDEGRIGKVNHAVIKHCGITIPE